MKSKIIIFGAGTVGRAAYYYYKNRVEVVCFVDNKEDIWGETLEDIPIYSPNIFATQDLSKIKIVIAIKDHWEEIQKQLFMNYYISESILFQIEEESLDFRDQETVFDSSAQEIIICYNGGLGNQMFQYTLAKCFMKQGKQVTQDLSAYNLWSKRRFELPFIFPNIQLKKCNAKTKLYYEKVLDYQFKEASLSKVDNIETNFEILDKNQGIIKGYWQNYKYVNMVEKELLHDFKFKNKSDMKLQEMIKYLSGQNTVSVHVRRGDYLQNVELYGKICTDEYYDKALNYINQQIENVTFCFFSNDIEWVSAKYKGIKKAIFVKKDMFEDYEDWYDMCLMSYCKHNIIANSTFSWWGAWLNRNMNKIVIAPKKWLNGIQFLDICPRNWIRL